MRRSSLLFLVLAALAAALCVRLGFWQLGRLGDRRAANALVSARLDSAVTTLDRLPADTALVRYRRVTVRGTLDFDGEVVLAGRSRNGSPGVNLLTPLRIAGRDTAVLVNRGWVYSPDAMTVQRDEWRERAEVELEGFVNVYHDPTAGPSVVGAQPRTIRRLDPAAIDSLVASPLAAFYVTATSPPLAPDGTPLPEQQAPVRLAPPPLDEGSHAGYAFQWFSFAAIALGGAGVVVWRGRQHRAWDGRRRAGSEQRARG